MSMDILKFNQCRVLVIGDLMIDEYLWGKVDRISPEAPVQVVSIIQEDYTLGGAGNVVNNLVSLGAQVSVCGIIGTGDNGKLLVDKLDELGVEHEGVLQDASRPTIKKTRIIAENQHVLRVDRESKKEISEQTRSAIVMFAENKIPDVDVVLVSDYGKGLITKRLLSRLAACAKKEKKIIIADPKGIDFSKYSGVSILTPNKKEASQASGIEISDDASLLSAGRKILQHVQIDNLLITCGKDGMVLFEKNELPYSIPAKAKQVYDVSGAGDTVIAVLGLALATGASYKDGAAIANVAAGIVVGKVGTATVSIKELGAAMNDSAALSINKHQTMADLGNLIRDLKKKRKKIVMTNGCFDLLHAGHIMLFAASKQLGDILIVAIDDDDSVRMNKGMGRPVIRAKERIQILSALDSVDYVVVFSSDKLENLIKTIRPDVLTKGSNYTEKDVLGYEDVNHFGGKVVLIPITENISSTQIINNIKRNG